MWILSIGGEGISEWLLTLTVVSGGMGVLAWVGWLFRADEDTPREKEWEKREQVRQGWLEEFEQLHGRPPTDKECMRLVLQYGTPSEKRIARRLTGGPYLKKD